MHSGRGDGPSRPPGYPIRKPPDHSLAAGSPGHIAGSSVLPRLLVPRHPPCALKNLAHHENTTHTQRNPPPRKTGRLQGLDARVHYAVLKIRTAPQPPPRTRETKAAACNRRTRASPFPQDPTARPPPPPPAPLVPGPAREPVLTGKQETAEMNSQCSTRKHGRPATHPVTEGASAP